MSRWLEPGEVKFKVKLRRSTMDAQTVYGIAANCPNGHTQTLRLEGFTREYAEGYAGLLDGTSPWYVHSPIGTDSLIGKCATCKAQIKCEVTEIKVDHGSGGS